MTRSVPNDSVGRLLDALLSTTDTHVRVSCTDLLAVMRYVRGTEMILGPAAWQRADLAYAEEMSRKIRREAASEASGGTN